MGLYWQITQSKLVLVFAAEIIRTFHISVQFKIDKSVFHILVNYQETLYFSHVWLCYWIAQ